MKKLTILVDMDDTIENLCETWVAFLNETHGTTVHTDDIHDWDMTKAFPTIEKSQVYDPLFDENMWKRVTPLLLHLKKEETLIFYKIICIKKYSLAYNDNIEG